MDINDARIGFTLASLLVFVGIAAWSWQRKRQRAFEEAARLPFVGEPAEPGERP